MNTDTITKTTSAGTLAQWQKHVAAPVAGDDMAVLAICCGLAGHSDGNLLLHLHFYGPAGSGKSALARLAASAVGSPRGIMTPALSVDEFRARLDQNETTLVVFDDVDKSDRSVCTSVIDAVIDHPCAPVLLSTGRRFMTGSRGRDVVRANVRIVEPLSEAVIAASRATEEFYGTAYHAYQRENYDFEAADIKKAAFSMLDVYDDGVAFFKMPKPAVDVEGLLLAIGYLGEDMISKGVLPWQKGTAIRAAMRIWRFWVADHCEKVAVPA